MNKNKTYILAVLLVTTAAVILFLMQGWALFGTESMKPINERLAVKESPLPIPPLLEDQNPDPKKAEYQLEVRNSTKEFMDGMETETLGYNGDYLGPVIQVRKGQEVSIKVVNTLDEETTVHWHGLKIDGEQDGGPHSFIKPGEEWNPVFTIEQPAATLWYHPHQFQRTGEQVYEGLAGLFYIEDEVTDHLNIPKEYGVNDIPLIIQDKSFNKNGQFEYKLNLHDKMTGLHGDTIIVNGAINPYLNVQRGLIRLRLLNGSNASIYKLSFSNHQSFYQIASDGGLLGSPAEMSELTLGPGERTEILVDFSRLDIGEEIYLKNNDTNFMMFSAGEEKGNENIIPERLTSIGKLNPENAIRTREFIFRGLGSTVNINGKQMDMHRVDEVVQLGTVEIWEINNYTGQTHPFHAHGVQFQLLDREGKAPAPNESGWKDTFLVAPGEDVRVIAKFENSGTFMYHCHILEHEDAGMMGQFRVE